MKRTLILTLLLCSLIFIRYSYSNDGRFLKIDSNATVTYLIDDTVRAISPNKDIHFDCTFGDTIEFDDNFLIALKCIVKNESLNDVNYLCQSCNGLEYYIIIKPNSHKVMPLFNCNGTWAIIKKLKSEESIEFETQILQNKYSDPIEKIGLDLRLVDQFIAFDELRDNPVLVEEVYLADTKENNIIWKSVK